MSERAFRSAGSSVATSRSLLALVRARDEAAWERLVSLYAPLVHHHCRRARLPMEDAADVFQEVFQATFSRIETFEKRRPSDTFRGWISTIARNKVNDHFRRQLRHPRAVGGTEIQRTLGAVRDPEGPAAGFASEDPRERRPDPADTDVERGVLAEALERIRPSFRERTWRAFLGTVVQGRSAKDVGEDLDMRSGAVRVAKSRVLQRLRSELGEI